MPFTETVFFLDSQNIFQPQMDPQLYDLTCVALNGPISAQTEISLRIVCARGHNQGVGVLIFSVFRKRIQNSKTS
jgi:hypothetical protein